VWALALVSLLGAGLAGPAAAAEPEITTVASGLDNPRGMDFAPSGALYVAEAGQGGDAYCFVHPFFGELCGGPSGAVTRIWRGQQKRVVTGLPSIGGAPDGSFSDGPEDVSFQGRGNLFVPIGFGGPPDAIDAFPASGHAHGWLIKANAGGGWKLVKDIAQFEDDHDPDQEHPGSEVDTNPKAVEAVAGGRAVVDAGGNDLLWVRADGRTSVLAVFDTRFVDSPFGVIPMQSVPTSVARGPDGAFYVGELTGFPFPTEMARIWRVVPGQAPQVWIDEGWFTNIMDIAFGPDGSLYVLEIDHDGLEGAGPEEFGGLWRVPAGGGDPELLLTEPLVLPGGIAVGRDGAIYVSVCAPCVDEGAVLRIVP
jgi:hypothetical protein